MLKVERESSLTSTDWVFYNVYSSEHNKESLEYLKFGMSLSEFITHKEYIDIRSAFDDEQRREADKKSKANRRS